MVECFTCLSCQRESERIEHGGVSDILREEIGDLACQKSIPDSYPEGKILPVSFRTMFIKITRAYSNPFLMPKFCSKSPREFMKLLS